MTYYHITERARVDDIRRWGLMPASLCGGDTAIHDCRYSGDDYVHLLSRISDDIIEGVVMRDAVYDDPVVVIVDIRLADRRRQDRARGWCGLYPSVEPDPDVVRDPSCMPVAWRVYGCIPADHIVGWRRLVVA